MDTTTSQQSTTKDEGPPQPPPTQPETYRQVAASHIAVLSEINRQLPKMLRYFATALTQLTDRPILDDPSSTDNLESRQLAFRKYATYTGMSVNLIREELVRQIEDLEKYKVIPASHPKFVVADRIGAAASTKDEARDPQEGVKNGGYGEFDVGVLNARASTGVGGEDVLERVQGVLEELVKRSGGVEGAKNGGEDKEMAVDD
ncbi:hypothetical protein NX059_003426 [Plenodomus lindquistii]|nr:hypothetical protein NX059_003426 [Plenodomus lindquistii]